MKKKLLIISVLLFCFILSGCGKGGEKDIISKLEKNLKETKGYNLVGVLEIQNNEDLYTYDVNVSFKENDMFRVSLKNQVNNHEQIILKNEDGVYVLTPSLNKSFKFQSEWPYNNSQSYLLQTILNDIKNDKDRVFKKTDDGYVFLTKANYSNNKNLIKQEILFDKNLNLKTVKIMNDKDMPLMKMTVTNVDMNATYNNTHFTLKGNMEVFNENNKEDVKTVSEIDEIIYPMYIPVNTHLSDQEQVSKSIGERVLLTFKGEKPFTFIQETSSKEENLTIMPINGNPEILGASIAAVSDKSVTWINMGMEYYIASEVLTKDELLEVAKSVSVMPVGK